MLLGPLTPLRDFQICECSGKVNTCCPPLHYLEHDSKNQATMNCGENRRARTADMVEGQEKGGHFPTQLGLESMCTKLGLPLLPYSVTKGLVLKCKRFLSSYVH